MKCADHEEERRESFDVGFALDLVRNRAVNRSIADKASRSSFQAGSLGRRTHEERRALNSKRLAVHCTLKIWWICARPQSLDLLHTPQDFADGGLSGRCFEFILH